MAGRQRQKQRPEGSISVREAGRRGGEATSHNHDHSFYEEIGQKGGEAGAKKGWQRGREFISRDRRSRQA